MLMKTELKEISLCYLLRFHLIRLRFNKRNDIILLNVYVFYYKCTLQVACVFLHAVFVNVLCLECTEIMCCMLHAFCNFLL